MSRYDFYVVIRSNLPDGSISKGTAYEWAIADSEEEAKNVVIRRIVDSGGWVEAIQRTNTPIPTKCKATARQYRMKLVVANEGEYRGGVEVKHHCTANSELAARRDALERAWYNGCHVVTFTSIQTKELP
ncbi:hypothetical protein M0R72_07515 [Candidatus Pacearchaeota archaeon]|jgi:hypothetical protein|nr:hypothetical protein [Candidatus Pacearchaeota archaeon]